MFKSYCSGEKIVIDCLCVEQLQYKRVFGLLLELFYDEVQKVHVLVFLFVEYLQVHLFLFAFQFELVGEILHDLFLNELSHDIDDSHSLILLL